jgi:hypothetical protein
VETKKARTPLEVADPRSDRRWVGCVLVILSVDAGHRDTAQGGECGESESDAEREDEPVPHLDDPHAATV